MILWKTASILFLYALIFTGFYFFRSHSQTRNHSRNSIINSPWLSGKISFDNSSCYAECRKPMDFPTLEQLKKIKDVIKDCCIKGKREKRTTIFMTLGSVCFSLVFKILTTLDRLCQNNYIDVEQCDAGRWWPKGTPLILVTYHIGVIERGQE